MQRNHLHSFIVALAVNGAITPAAFAQDDPEVCFYLDKEKIEDELVPVRLESASGKPLALRDEGLVHGSERSCPWLKYGAPSQVREAFELDEGVFVPVLRPDCAAPFKSIYTGVGFGDWHLTLCGGRTSNDEVVVSFQGAEYSVEVERLEQWTKYDPEGEFPVAGNYGHVPAQCPGKNDHTLCMDQ